MKFESVLLDQTEELIKFLRSRESKKPKEQRKRFTSRDIFNLPDFEMKKVFEDLLNTYGESGFTYSGFLHIKNKVYWILTKAVV